MAALVISFLQELFYYIARSSCAKCNEAVSAFIVRASRGFSSSDFISNYKQFQ